MSKNNQNSQPLSTEEKLEFFIERADVLSRYFSENFTSVYLDKFSVYRSTNIAGDEWKFHTLVYGLICLIRVFFLEQDKIALYPITDNTHKKLVPNEVPLRQLSNEPNWCEAVDRAINTINELFYGIGTPPDAEPLVPDYPHNDK